MRARVEKVDVLGWNKSQYGPQSLITWLFPPFWYIFQPLLSWHHLRRSIPNPCRPLCRRFCVLLLGSNPGGPIQNITPRTHPNRFHGRFLLFIRYYIYLNQTQIREHLRPSIPIGIHYFHSPSVLGSHCKQGSQHDSVSFRVSHRLLSSRWPPWSQSSTSKTGLSYYFWLHQFSGNLHSPWHIPCTHLSCLVQQCSPPLTLQGSSPCSQILNGHKWIRHLLSLTLLVYNPGIQPFPPSSW